MSFYLKIKDKTSLASGDGAKNGTEGPVAKTRRSAVPSSRRFGTRSLSNSSNKTVLKKAIEELTSPVIRKKALTLAEITPVQNKSRRIREETADVCWVKPLSPLQKQHLAGRRVYEALLLHAWRRRKLNFGVLTESLRAVETRNRKLELQIEALHRLRLAESEKRNEAVTQTQIISRENEETIHKNKALQKEKELLEDEVNIYREKLRSIQLEFETIRNDLTAKQIDLENSEYELSLEKRKVKRLLAEKSSLEEQVAIARNEYQDYKNHFEELQDKLIIAESSLHNSIVSNDTFKKENEELLQKLDIEVSTTRSLLENNERLKFCLFAIKRVLKKEKNRPWWRNASELGFAFLSSLKDFAIILLPITPHQDIA